MALNSFRPRKYVDHAIVDENQKAIGHIRVKPSSILWAPKNGKLWFGLSLFEFATYMENNGKKQKK